MKEELIIKEKKYEIEIIENLFKKLRKRNISYVVISNYFYKKQRGGDIDLYVPIESKSIFLKTIESLGFQQRKKPSMLPNHNFYIFFNGFISIVLDVKHDLSFYMPNGCIWIYKSLLEVIPNRQKIEESFRPKGFDAIILYIAHCISLEKKVLEKRHLDNLKFYIKKFRNEVNDREELRIVENLFSSIHDIGLMEFTKELSKILKQFFIIKKRFIWWYKFKNSFRFGSGFKILFLGADGTGKTTLVRKLKEKLPFSNRILYLGMGKDGWLMKWIQKYQKFCNDNYWAGRLRFIIIFTWLFLPLELFLRQLKISFHSKYANVLIDRFPGYPFLTGKVLKWLYRHLLPKPDLIILLGGDPESIATRKPTEVSKGRVELEHRKWIKVAKEINTSHVLKLDTVDNDLNKCLEKILLTIKDHPEFKKKMFKPISSE